MKSANHTLSIVGPWIAWSLLVSVVGTATFTGISLLATSCSAHAHPPEECECVCEDAESWPMSSTPMIVLDPEDTDRPVVVDPSEGLPADVPLVRPTSAQKVAEPDMDKIQKALDAIKQAEKVEADQKSE